MSVPLPVPLENVPQPVYALPSTQQIRVNPGKRGREDENDVVSVVGSVKRVKPLDTASNCMSTPRAMEGAGKSSLLEARGPPSIHNASEYLDAMFGYGTQTEKHYEYGSDTDEEDPPSDNDEPMLSVDDDTPESTPEDEDDPMTDISEEAFRAEIDELSVSSDDFVKNFFSMNSDSDSDDDESEFGATDGDEEKVIEWAKPGPSPLRREMDLSLDKLKRLTLIPRKEKPRKVIPIARTSRHPGVYHENAWRKAINRCHYRTLHLPSIEFGEGIMKSAKVPGKQKPEPSADGTIPVDISPTPTPSIELMENCAMGRGTPPRFRRWTPLTPPPSRYAYWTPDDTIPFPRFNQRAFHGPDAWGTLYRTARCSTQAADAQTWEGYMGGVGHLLLVGVGPARRGIEMRTDRRAMQHLRAHAEELASMPGRVPSEDLRGVTTGMILEEAERMQALMRARAPSPEQLFGPWLPWTPPPPEFVVGSSKDGS